MPRTSTKISKTRFQGGLRCLRRLWLESYHRERAAAPDRAARLRMATGHTVGELARRRWPQGRLVDIAPARHARAVEATRALLADASVGAVFEGAFEFGGVRVRADSVVRTADGPEIYEVKSSARVRDEHLTDVAVQLYAIEGQGWDVSRAFLMHVDRDYVWDGGEYDPARLLRAVDVTAEARALAARIDGELTPMRAVLALDTEPTISVGRHCRRPYPCAFKPHCWRDAPPHHVSELPRAGLELLERLRADAIEDIGDMPAGRYPLSELQEMVRRSVAIGGTVVRTRSLRRALSAIKSPVTFLDFETFAPPLPVYAGTRPYEVIPFQWSAHVVHGREDPTWRDFLWTEASDPRPQFIATLLAALPESGSIVVYSGYEEQRLADLAERFPQDATRLLDAFRARSVDLLEVVRGSVYHPQFHGSYSLKRVLPALVPGACRERLAIAEGADAAAAYAELVSKGCPAGRRDSLVGALRAYCRADSHAALELLAALHHLARPGRARARR